MAAIAASAASIVSGTTNLPLATPICWPVLLGMIATSFATRRPLRAHREGHCHVNWVWQAGLRRRTMRACSHNRTSTTAIASLPRSSAATRRLHTASHTRTRKASRPHQHRTRGRSVTPLIASCCSRAGRQRACCADGDEPSISAFRGSIRTGTWPTPDRGTLRRVWAGTDRAAGLA